MDSKIIEKIADKTYCVVIHDRVHVQHVVMFEDKPNIHNIKHILDEMENDPEFIENLSAPIDELNMDLMSFGQAMRCMPEEWQEKLKEQRKHLNG